MSVREIDQEDSDTLEAAAILEGMGLMEVDGQFRASEEGAIAFLRAVIRDPVVREWAAGMVGRLPAIEGLGVLGLLTFAAEGEAWRFERALAGPTVTEEEARGLADLLGYTSSEFVLEKVNVRPPE